MENMLKLVVSTVPADGLAPSGARPSAGTVMSKLACSTCLNSISELTLHISALILDINL